MAGESTISIDGDEPDDADPRLSREYVRDIDRSGAGLGAVTLVGVVHDHPASAYRARRIVAARAPDVLALELPPLAVPLFERYAGCEATPPATGGEMSAAIQAADAERTAGIDGPTASFAGRLARTLVAERASLSTARTAVTRFGTASGHAVKCRLASALGAVTDHTPVCSEPRVHDVDGSDEPAVQAEDEHRQVRLARSIASAFGADRAVATRDATREAHMAERLATLAETGDVVAVLGVDHLDPVAERLRAA